MTASRVPGRAPGRVPGPVAAAVVVLALATAVSACADAGDGGSRSSPTTPTTPTTPSTSPPVSSPSTPPGDGGGGTEWRLVTPHPEARPTAREAPFEEAVPSPSDPRVVLVRFWGGVAPCDVVAAVDVEETSDTVTITVWRGPAPAP